MGRERARKGKHLLIFAACVMLLLPACAVFREAEKQKPEKTHVEIEQLRRDVDLCRQEAKKLQQENDRLRLELEKARKDIEKAGRVDMEIEEKRRQLGR